MAIEKTVIGNKVYYVEKDAQLLFTKTELTSARNRYNKERAKQQRDA